ncbi:MAG: hypothetical protein ACI8Q1_003776 [Parvicella sp.]|jgi:hypothetical protein
MKLKNLICIAAVFGFTVASAQYEMSSFTTTGRGGATTFVTDYQACGINPANLGWQSEFEDKKFTMGFTELTFSVHSDALTKDELRSEFKNAISGSTNGVWSSEQKRTAAQDFANSGLAMNLDFGTFGFSFATEKLGGIAFRINDNMTAYSKLNEEMTDIVFLGKISPYFNKLNYYDSVAMDTVVIDNYEMQDEDSIANVLNGFASLPQKIGEIMNGSEIRASWTREYNLSYGRKIFGVDDQFEMYAGIGLKYIQGFGMINVKSENDVLTAFSAITPAFNIDFGSASASNPSTIQQGSGTMPKPVGSGVGVDFGINALIKGKLKLAVAVTNIGSMKWTGNVYSLKDTLIVGTDAEGLNSYNVFQSISEFSGNDGVFSWDGEQEIVTKLPSTARMGASMILGEKAHIGLDILMPFSDESPASLEKALIGFGGDFSPIPWLRLSGGFLTGGNYDFSIPLGITVITKGGSWEAGVASRDAVTFFTQNGPTLSFSTGFARFRF